jgi:hypothetical protein
MGKMHQTAAKLKETTIPNAVQYTKKNSIPRPSKIVHHLEFWYGAQPSGNFGQELILANLFHTVSYTTVLVHHLPGVVVPF